MITLPKDDGVFTFIKPPGITSHDAVGIVRRILKIKRVGHSGTLDPLAYGVLPIFVGKATRLIEYTESFTKTYVAEGCFGISTDTEDSTGNCIAKAGSDVVSPTWETLLAVCNSFIGRIEQQPSMYSAIKVDGKRAYELARMGKMVTLPSREITIYSLDLLAYKYPYFTIKVTCSSGTYIRALLRDIFAKLAIPGTMTQLARTQVGPFRIEEGLTAEELESIKIDAFKSVDLAVAHYKSIYFTPSQVRAIKQGKRILVDHIDLSLGENTHTVANIDEYKPYFRSYGDNAFIGVVELVGAEFRVSKNLY